MLLMSPILRYNMAYVNVIYAVYDVNDNKW